jgi:hypothetical protein
MPNVNDRVHNASDRLPVHRPVGGGATSDNNVVGASARLRRAPEYTARKLWWSVDGGDMVGRSMADELS